MLQTIGDQDEMGVVFEAKAHRYIPNITEQKL